MSVICENNIIQNHQFGFREKHFTIEQVHIVTKFTSESVKNKNTVLECFRPYNERSIMYGAPRTVYRIKLLLPDAYFPLLIASYLCRGISGLNIRTQLQDYMK